MDQEEGYRGRRREGCSRLRQCVMPGRQRHASSPPSSCLCGFLVSLSDDACDQLIPGVL